MADTYIKPVSQASAKQVEGGRHNYFRRSSSQETHGEGTSEMNDPLYQSIPNRSLRTQTPRKICEGLEADDSDTTAPALPPRAHKFAELSNAEQ